MSRKLQYATDFPFPAEDVFLAGVKSGYIEAEAAFLTPEHEELRVLDITEDGPSGGRMTMTYKVETSLPGWAKKVLPSRNTITEKHVWQPAAADGSRTYTFDVEIATVPAQAKGSATVRPTGPTSCRVETEIDIDAWMPLVGKKLEDLVARDLGPTVEGKMAFMSVWMKQQA